MRDVSSHHHVQARDSRLPGHHRASPLNLPPPRASPPLARALPIPVALQVNTTNIKMIAPELFQLNLVRGRGLFARAVMKAQLASPGFTPIFAALVSVVNTKLPDNGELILKRVIVAFRRAYKRRDKVVATALAKFVAHLVNQQVNPINSVEQVMMLVYACLHNKRLFGQAVRLPACWSWVDDTLFKWFSMCGVRRTLRQELHWLSVLCSSTRSQ